MIVPRCVYIATGVITAIQSCSPILIYLAGSPWIGVMRLKGAGSAVSAEYCLGPDEED